MPEKFFTELHYHCNQQMHMKYLLILLLIWICGTELKAQVAGFYIYSEYL